MSLMTATRIPAASAAPVPTEQPYFRAVSSLMVVAGEWGARHSYSGHIASLLADHDSQSMRLGYIITDPAVRGQGRGRALVEAAVARGFEKTDFPLITLGVYAHNHRALGLYESLEFKPTGASIETVVGDETWQAMEMALSRDVWLRNDHTSSFH